MIENENLVEPDAVEREDLLLVHTERYLSSLNWSIQLARVLEVPAIAFLPNILLQWKVLRPFRYQSGGSILVIILRGKRNEC